MRNAAIAAAIIFFVFHLLVDGARAHFAAEPGRRSAFLALWGSVKLLVRRPLRMLAIGAMGAIAALGSAALNSARRFAVTAFAPALLNVSCIAFALALPGWLGAHDADPILAMAIGALRALREGGRSGRPLSR